MTVLIQQQTSSGKRRRCDARCYNGKNPRCRCICGGHNHGKGLERAVEETRKRFDVFAEGNGIELFVKPAGGEDMNRSLYDIVSISDEAVTIRDIGHMTHRSVTNDAEKIVPEIVALGVLRPGMRLFYYDSENQLDEIKVQDGKFAGFAPGPR